MSVHTRDDDIVEPIAVNPPVRVLDAETVEADPAVRTADIIASRPRVTLIGQIWRLIGSSAEWLFGFASLIVGLAVLATIPIVQFATLGYLLECSGRIVRTGRVRDGFVGVRKAARAGSIVLGTWLVLWPVRFVSSMWYDAQLIDATSAVARAWRVGLLILTAMTVAHVLWAWSRGGRLRHFVWPAPLRFVRWIREPAKYRSARDAVWNYITSLRPVYYFKLGLVGFVGTLAWLFLPISLFIGATTLPPEVGIASGILGSVLLGGVILHLPILQTHFAAEQRFSALFNLPEVYRTFFRAPILSALAVISTLTLALPLYLLKIELTAQQVAILPSLVFVVFILPARLLQGWAVSRAAHRGEPKRFILRLFTCSAAMATCLPIAGLYVFIVFFTRYTSWYGVWSLFEQHAFLVPVPFLGL